MAKINHNNYVDTVNEMVSQAKQRQVMHLDYTGENWNGNEMILGQRRLVNFGTCGYLGLETHSKLIYGAKDFLLRYGTQFSISRAYVNSSQNKILEDKLGEIFAGSKTIVFSSTTLTHFSVMPIVIGNEDALVVDRQAHFSMQTAMKLPASLGVPISLIRHNDLQMLEEQILALRDKHQKIWYVIDGVYSMYGDQPPYADLNELAKKYPQLHFYVDDAHGMSWNGHHGCGCAFKYFKDNGRTILITTMAKGFGSTGGIAVFPDEKTFKKVLTFGGPLSYSHPIAPAILGASMASAEIHLSDEICHLQQELQEKIYYCNELLRQTDIPLVSSPNVPIFFLGTGQPNVGFNMNKRILDEGYYVNLGIFPAVSMKNTGLRFTVTNHVTKEEIYGFVEALKYHYPKALLEEGKMLNEVREAFKLPKVKEDNFQESSNDYHLEVHRNIDEVDKSLWNHFMSDKAGCTWNNMKMTESIYRGNIRREENGEFYYFIVRGADGNVVCTSVFSYLLMKDDMFEPEGRSIAVEQIRTKDPFYLTSKTFFMGTTLSEGDHLYLDYSVDWKRAFGLVLEYLGKELERTDGNHIVLRDFEPSNVVLADYLYESGYAKVELPNSNIISDLRSFNEESYFEHLSPRSRRHIRNDVYKYQEDLTIEVASELSGEELVRTYELLRNVSDKNFAVNIFPYPFRLIQEMNSNSTWEFIKISLKGQLVAIGFCHLIGTDYFPILVGIDYKANESHKVYKQMLYQVVIRAISLGCDKVFFGLSADTEKRKLGAQQIPKVGFLYAKDNFNFETLNTITVQNEIGA